MPQIGSFTRDKTGFAGHIQTFLGSHAEAQYQHFSQRDAYVPQAVAIPASGY
ncbi:hypothetical protein [Acetobacter sp.]|uniref:hypothetical protein n=1 Tax=Acetobacter sp. TaxID=440 RepID=UPI0039EB6C7D